MSSVNLYKKRKRVVLSVNEKCDILNRLRSGETAVSLSREYNIGKSTICSIKSNEDKILKYQANVLTNTDCNKIKKVISSAENTTLEDAVYLWFLQQRAIGKPISGPILCKKALQLNEKMRGNANFKASNGWLRNFKKRHGIRLLNAQGEKLTTNVESAGKFKKYIQDFILQEDYSDDCIYNADETGLYWRSLPQTSTVSCAEITNSECNSSKDRVTILFCSNATGSHKFPLLIIGRSRQPKCFKHVSRLPVLYKTQKNGWMDAETFKEWYFTDFIPSVKEYQNMIGRTEKVLLILNNAPAHISKDLLSLTDETFRIMFLPSNVTSLLQSMYQGTIETTKRIYRKNLLRRLLIMNEGNENLSSSLKGLTLTDCCYMLSDIWNLTTENNLQEAWRQFLCIEQTVNVIDTKPNSEEIESIEILELAKRISCCAECNIKDIMLWLRSDAEDKGFKIFNDDDIISEVMGYESTATIKSDDEKSEQDEKPIPSDADALNSINIVIKWLEAQSQLNTASLQCLHNVKDFIITKSLNTME